MNPSRTPLRYEHRSSDRCRPPRRRRHWKCADTRPRERNLGRSFRRRRWRVASPRRRPPSRRPRPPARPRRSLRSVLAKRHPHACRRTFESNDAAEVFADGDAVVAERRRDSAGNVFVFGRNDARPGLKEFDSRAERVEDRGDLRSRRAGTDDDRRLRNRGQAESVARRYRQLPSRNVELSADPAGANHHLACAERGRAFAGDGMRVHEMRRSGVLVDGHAGAIDLRPQRGVRRGFGNDFAGTCQQCLIIERDVARRDAVPGELPRFADETGGVRERTHGNGAVVGGHPTECASGHQRRRRAEIGAAQRRGRARRACADDEEVHVAGRHSSLVPNM